MKRLFLALAFASQLVFPVQASATYYPNSGRLYYDGQYFAESVMSWSSPGPWSSTQPGYEHDLMTNDNYFSSCTSFSGLPNGYDDCPTAGVGDPSGKRIFSFGSFDADRIEANVSYWGYWQFSGGGASSSPYNLYGQEVQHWFCFFDNIWCMNGVQTRELQSGTLNRGQSFTRYW